MKTYLKALSKVWLKSGYISITAWVFFIGAPIAYLITDQLEWWYVFVVIGVFFVLPIGVIIDQTDL